MIILIAVAAWQRYMLNRNSEAFYATVVGDSYAAVVARFGSPSVEENCARRQPVSHARSGHE